MRSKEAAPGHTSCRFSLEGHWMSFPVPAPHRLSTPLHLPPSLLHQDHIALWNKRCQKGQNKRYPAVILADISSHWNCLSPRLNEPLLLLPPTMATLTTAVPLKLTFLLLAAVNLTISQTVTFTCKSWQMRLINFEIYPLNYFCSLGSWPIGTLHPNIFFIIDNAWTIVNRDAVLWLALMSSEFRLHSEQHSWLQFRMCANLAIVKMLLKLSSNHLILFLITASLSCRNKTVMYPSL